jgi:hypothetical protein
MYGQLIIIVCPRFVEFCSGASVVLHCTIDNGHLTSHADNVAVSVFASQGGSRDRVIGTLLGGGKDGQALVKIHRPTGDSTFGSGPAKFPRP